MSLLRGKAFKILDNEGKEIRPKISAIKIHVMVIAILLAINSIPLLFLSPKSRSFSNENE